ncbi:hypothetical protein [Rhodopirellula sallentina]|uniref:Uncharacterized protein n=1 Tax=Rhodopirellula sallentina SM41 TaxID=1263870 RepID=M5UCK0_9BACT|nr:hypothetical protein [Rhodopirellula sallentina]EMI53708.1 hypothetical protein RSSM_04849 [Rhodopirellula sallentina SM41]
MAKSEQQRQKKLARKKAKDRQKKQQLVREKQQLVSLSGKMAAAASGRILNARMAEPKSGLATVLFARQAPNGHVAVVVFLVDTYCLGVKNVIAGYRSMTDYREMLEDLSEKHRLQERSPGTLRGFIEGAVAFAGRFGLPPHADYRKVSPIWGDVESEPTGDAFEFGRDGKPVYVPGPFDDDAMRLLVLSRLGEHLDVGDFEAAVVEVGGADMLGESP